MVWYDSHRIFGIDYQNACLPPTQRKMEEAQREKEELSGNMEVLQQEKEQLEEEKERLQKRCEQEEEMHSKLIREHQVSTTVKVHLKQTHTRPIQF